MWISKKKYKQLEKRLADLEKMVQDQPEKVISEINKITKAQGASPLIM